LIAAANRAYCTTNQAWLNSHAAMTEANHRLQGKLRRESAVKANLFR
jgi:hypothetical protein